MESKKVLKLIQERHSTRDSFNPRKKISKQDMVKILEAARWSPTPHNMQNFEVIVVDDEKLLDSIGEIEYVTPDAFILENYPLLSSSVEELKKRKVGILGAGFPSSMRSPKLKNGKPVEKFESSLGGFLENGPVLLVVVYDPKKRAPASKGDFLGTIGLGCVMENMWLMAQSLGIGFQVLSSISNRGVENKVKKLLNIPKKLKIAFSIRLGYPSSS
jgi:nitroreductase